MITLDDSVSVDSVHVDSATPQPMKPPVNKSPSAKAKAMRTAKKAGSKKPSVMGGRKGLNMKIGADGSMHIRHLADGELSGLALMPPIEFAET